MSFWLRSAGTSCNIFHQVQHLDAFVSPLEKTGMMINTDHASSSVWSPCRFGAATGHMSTYIGSKRRERQQNRAFLDLGFVKSVFCNLVLFTKTTGISKTTKTTQTSTKKGIDGAAQTTIHKNHGNGKNHGNLRCKTYFPQT